MLDPLISFICWKMLTVGRNKKKQQQKNKASCSIFRSLQRSEPHYLLDAMNENDMKEINPDEAGNKEVIMTKCSKREMQETCLFFVIQVLQAFLRIRSLFPLQKMAMQN